MGCQCINKKEEEEINDELSKKNNTLEEVNEEDLYKDNDNNNFPNKEEILGLTHEEKINTEQINEPNNLHNIEDTHENQEETHENHNKRINEDKNMKYADFPEKMLELINKIRENPALYAEVIEDSIRNIKEIQNEDDENNPRIIYKNKVKVALTRGEIAFREAAEKLKNMPSLSPLEFKNDICVPLPETEEELKDPSYLKEQVKILRENAKIDIFFKDLIKIPEVSALIMIVDDCEKNPGKKRNAIMNKNFKYIGISSKFIGKNFISYFTFSSQ